MSHSVPWIRWAAFAARHTVVQPWFCILWGVRSDYGRRLHCARCRRRLTDAPDAIFGIVVTPPRLTWVQGHGIETVETIDPRTGDLLCRECLYVWHGVDAADPDEREAMVGPAIAYAPIIRREALTGPDYGWRWASDTWRDRWGEHSRPQRLARPRRRPYEDYGNPNETDDEGIR